jgi:hypothetical protein
MATNKQESFGPIAVPNAAGNLIAPAAAGAGPVGYTATATYILLRHIRILNKTGGAVTFSLYKGATGGSAAGTEFMGTAVSIPANSYVDWYGQLRLEGTNGFLTGLASAATSLVLTAEGEVGLV